MGADEFYYVVVFFKIIFKWSIWRNAVMEELIKIPSSTHSTFH